VSLRVFRAPLQQLPIFKTTEEAIAIANDTHVLGLDP
jgi:hypothetical protein